VQLGSVSTDGTKIQGNVSRHKAMSYGYMKKEVERIREAIEALVTRAYQQDEAEEAALGSRRGDELPAELARREARLAKIEAAMRRLEAEAKAEADAERPGRVLELVLGRLAVVQPVARIVGDVGEPHAAVLLDQHIDVGARGGARDAERQRRCEADAERQRNGQKRRGKAPKEVDETPADKAQMSFTDPELHIMQTPNKGWDYCGNAQASVDGAYQIIVACDVTDATNDKQQAAPMAQAILETLEQAAIAPPRNAAGEVPAIPATLDSGYYSEAATQALETLGFEPYIATARQRHHALESEPLKSSATAQERMAAKVRGPAGQALYSRRKVIVEPVFGQIKEARGFRRFLLRGLDKVRGEWRLVCVGHNLLKLWRYGSALRTV